MRMHKRDHIGRRAGGFRQSAAAVVGVAMAASLHGCKSTPNPYETPPPTRSELTVTSHVGGTHYCTLVHDGTWYQTFSNELLVLDDRTNVGTDGANLIDTIELGKFGSCGPATDLELLGTSLYVLLDDDQVIECAIDDPWSPRETRRWKAKDLGISPQAISIADGRVYVSGRGGVVQILPAQMTPAKPSRNEPASIALGVLPVVTSDQTFGSVVTTPLGLAVTVGRRIVSVPELRYLGSANEVIALTPALGGPSRVAFRWNGTEASVVGLMGPDLRELCRKSFLAPVHAVRAIGDTLWVVTDDAIVAYRASGDDLEETLRVAVFGARDVAPLRENYLAIAGTFGRSIYRIKQDESGPGDAFIGTKREASRLENSTYDGRFVLAGSHEGHWLYEIERGVTMAERSVMQPIDPPREVRTLRGNASLDDSNQSLRVTFSGGGYTYAPPTGEAMHCIASVDGDIWIGHDHGITVLSGDATVPQVKAELRLPGPIITLYQLRVGGGATYVSELGGFGVARWIVEQIPYED